MKILHSEELIQFLGESLPNQFETPAKRVALRNKEVQP